MKFFIRTRWPRYEKSEVRKKSVEMKSSAKSGKSQENLQILAESQENLVLFVIFTY